MVLSLSTGRDDASSTHRHSTRRYGFHVALLWHFLRAYAFHKLPLVSPMIALQCCTVQGVNVRHARSEGGALLQRRFQNKFGRGESCRIPQLIIKRFNHNNDDVVDNNSRFRRKLPDGIFPVNACMKASPHGHKKQVLLQNTNSER